MRFTGPLLPDEGGVMLGLTFHDEDHHMDFGSALNALKMGQKVRRADGSEFLSLDGIGGDENGSAYDDVIRLHFPDGECIEWAMFEPQAINEDLLALDWELVD